MRPKKIVLTDRSQLYKIVGRVNTIGLEATAASLECDPSTLSRWLKKEGYVVRRTWELTSAGKEAMHVQETV